MNGLLFYAIVVMLVGVLARPGRSRTAAQVGLAIFAGVTWFCGVAMVAFSIRAGLAVGGLAAITTALAATSPGPAIVEPSP